MVDDDGAGTPKPLHPAASKHKPTSDLDAARSAPANEIPRKVNNVPATTVSTASLTPRFGEAMSRSSVAKKGKRTERLDEIEWTEVSRDLKEKQKKVPQTNENLEELSVAFLSNYLTRTQVLGQQKEKREALRQKNEKLQELSRASPSNSPKRTHVVGQRKEKGRKDSHTDEKLQKLLGVSATNSSKLTQVSRDFKEKGGLVPKTTEKLKKLSKASSSISQVSGQQKEEGKKDPQGNDKFQEHSRAFSHNSPKPTQVLGRQNERGQKVPQKNEKLQELPRASSDSPKRTQVLGQRKEKRKTDPQTNAKLQELSRASSSTSSKRTQVLGQRKEKEKKDPHIDEKLPKLLRAPSSSSSTRTQVSRDSREPKAKKILQTNDELPEASSSSNSPKVTKISSDHLKVKEKKILHTNEEWKKFPVATRVNQLCNFLQKVPMDEIKDMVDVKELKSLHCLLTHYLKEACNSGTSEVSFDRRDEGTFSLDDLVQMFNTSSPAATAVQTNNRLELLKIVGHAKLVDKNGRPSPLLLHLMRQILSAVSHLHDQDRHHGRLNPQSISITLETSFSKEKSDQKEFPLRAKLISDSNRLSEGSDISKWRAPEQREDCRVSSCSADIYSLGQIFYYCITGKSPSFELKGGGNKSSSLMVCLEAVDLVHRMLRKDPKSRPTAKELLRLPLLLTSEERVSFLCETSESLKRSDDPNQYSNLEGASTQNSNQLRTAVHKIAVSTVGKGKGYEERLLIWDKRIREDVISHMQIYATYKFDNVRDLLRFIRNMKSHYEELPEHIKQTVGTLYSGFDGYITSLFPGLLFEVYNAVYENRKEDERFGRYFNGS